MPPQGHTSLTYLQQDNFDSAYAVMDRLPVEFKLKEKEISEKDRTKQFIGIVQGYRSGGRSETELNESDLSALRAMAADVYDRPAEWAQNIVRDPATGAQGNRWQIGTLAIWRIPSSFVKPRMNTDNCACLRRECAG